MKTKSYKITFCLESGYSATGEKYSADDAKALIEGWMIKRIEANLPTVSGVAVFGSLFFPAKGRREDGKSITVAEAGVYMGDIRYNDESQRNDDEIKDALNSLALVLKEGLKQDRIYIIYETESWYL